jgi:hypothetical protein
MKRLTLLLLLVLPLTSVQAESSLKSSKSSGRQFSRAGSAEQGVTTINPNQELPTPRASGIIYEISEQGLIIINPAAPKEIDVKSSTWAEAPQSADLLTHNDNEAKRKGGGFKLISWEW